MNKFFLITFLLIVTSCSAYDENYNIFIDRESRKLSVVRDNKTVFETQTSYWNINRDYITEVIISENEIKTYLYDCIKNKLTEYPFDHEIKLKGNVLGRLHKRDFIDYNFDLLLGKKTLFFYFAYGPKPGIYSMNLEEKGNSINLVYETREDIRFLEVSDEYLCFISYFDSLWVKSFKNDSLYGMCLSDLCEAMAKGLAFPASNTHPTGFLLIDPNKLLVGLSNETFYILNLNDLTKKDFKSSIHPSYDGNCFSERKLYYYTEELGEEVGVVNKISINSLDLDSYEIDSNIFEISKPEDYYSIYVYFYSIDRENKLHLYLSKTKRSLDEIKEFDEWFDYIIYDLKERKVVSKKENLDKIERYLLR